MVQRLHFGRMRRNAGEGLTTMRAYRERWQLLRETSRGKERGESQHHRASQ